MAQDSNFSHPLSVHDARTTLPQVLETLQPRERQNVVPELKSAMFYCGSNLQTERQCRLFEDNLLKGGPTVTRLSFRRPLPLRFLGPQLNTVFDLLRSMHPDGFQVSDRSAKRTLTGWRWTSRFLTAWKHTFPKTNLESGLGKRGRTLCADGLWRRPSNRSPSRNS